MKSDAPTAIPPIGTANIAVVITTVVVGVAIGAAITAALLYAAKVNFFSKEIGPSHIWWSYVFMHKKTVIIIK